MEKVDLLKYSVVGLIIVSLSFLLVFMRGGIIGFVINSLSIENNESCIEKECNLDVVDIKEIIAYEGSKKNFLLPVQNKGEGFLNNCNLVAKGDIEKWIYSTEVFGIAPGEKKNFIFSLNVPDKVSKQNYSGEIGVFCDEFNQSQKINVIIKKGLQVIDLINIKEVNKGLEIDYSLDNSNLIGENIEVDIWLVDETGMEIKREKDFFNINKEGAIQRKILMDLGKKLEGVYYIYFALSEDLDNFMKQTVVFGGSTTGNVVLGEEGNNLGIYFVFLLFIGTGVFFIFRRHWKNKPKNKKLVRVPRA